MVQSSTKNGAARDVRRPGREAGTQAREGDRAGHFGADGDCEVTIPALDSGFPAGMTREAATQLSPHRRRSDRGWGAAADGWRRRRASIGQNLVQGLGREHALGPAQQGLGIGRFDPLRDGRG